ncbi:NrfD/PsrC family molybdoenzyme membrane anchor subunit [Ferrimonas pelagia]|uniref:Polysulfide reductase NrfD n=1 Tax=Ferrimonas pelagia TaxID=1177826 RepID=A0ABP9F3A4_9GAMM
MNATWGSVTQYDPVIWNWMIASYLFLAGLSAGALIVALAIRWYRKAKDQPYDHTPTLQAAALIAPVSICLGMLFLVMDLTKPLEFYLIVLNYNPSSVMSLGVMALNLYIPLTFVFCFWVFRKPIQRRLPRLTGLIDRIDRHHRGLLVVLFALALIAAIYTGILLSVLNSYPILNTAVLPALFLASSIAAGSAGNSLVGYWLARHQPSDDLNQMHQLEYPVAFSEALCLVLLFVGLLFSGPAAQTAINALTNGAWAVLFWSAVVGLGLGVPVLANLFASKHWLHGRFASLLLPCCTLVGVLAMRYFVVYAGQSYTI